MKELNHKGTVVLETERLILRPFRLTDAEKMYNNWASDDEVTKYLYWPTHKNPEESAGIIEQWLEDYKGDKFYNWAVILKENDELIGSIGGVELNERNNSIALGYCIGRNWWNKGYTGEAAKRLVKFYFEEVGFNRVSAWHADTNVFSGKVMEKCGMVYEGTFRDGIGVTSGVYDARYYAVLAKDYFGRGC